MIVPFAKGQAQQPQGPQPSETDMLMALAHMHQMGRIKTAQLDDAQKVFRDQMYGTKDSPVQSKIDELPLGYAEPPDGEVGDKDLMPWRDKVIDVNKLSPKHLKALQAIPDK